MNWEILNRLADSDEHFLASRDLMLAFILDDGGYPSLAGEYARYTASIAHELMDRADDLDAMERDEYYEMHPPEDY